jgi:hypothetical protein
MLLCSCLCVTSTVCLWVSLVPAIKSSKHWCRSLGLFVQSSGVFSFVCNNCVYKCYLDQFCPLNIILSHSPYSKWRLSNRFAHQDVVHCLFLGLFNGTFSTFWARSVMPISTPYFFMIRYCSQMYSLFVKWSLHLEISAKTVYAFLKCPMHAAWPVHLRLLDLINLMIQRVSWVAQSI